MAHAVQDPPGSPPDAPTTVGDRVRTVLRGVGEALISLGLVVLLFVVYEVWITNLFADRNNSRNISALRKEVDTVQAALPGDADSTIPIGKSLGILYIPRLGRDYAEAIVQGNDVPNDEQLQQGTAHYGRTQLPGEKGNFAVAGHRVGKGEPFLNIDKLRSGDAVIVETRTTWYVYRVMGLPDGTNTNPQTDRTSPVPTTDKGTFQVPGREIIEPSNGNVLYPVPNHPEVPLASASAKLMTMTTCHPKFTATQRMIVFSQLVGQVPALGNTSTTKASDMPDSVSKLYDEVQS